MARRQVAPARKPLRNQHRQAPYALPYRTTPTASGDSQLKPKYTYQQLPEHHRRRRSVGVLPESPHSSSDGVPTPGSTPVSPTTSPFLTHPSPALSSHRYPAPLSEETPCTDNISVFVFGEQQHHHSVHAFDYQSPPFASWPDQPQSLTILTPTDSSSSSLAGIQTSPETDSFVHLVEFPNGPTPTRLQSFPQTQGPWAPYSLRQDDPMILDTDSSPSSLASALSPASSLGRARRVGPLSQDQRRNANKVRDVGACLRCSYMKERCDEDPACSNCRNKVGRKWKLGCVRQKLNDRVDRLFPPPIEDRYDMKHTNRYVDGTGFFYLHDQPSFTLTLNMGLGGPSIGIPVKEIEPVEHQRILQSFQVNSDSGSLDTLDSWDPPIVPYLTPNKDGWVKELFAQLGMSMRSVFEKKHSGGYYWPWKCFEGMSCDWVGDVVEKIHEFHHNAPTVTYFQPIRTAHTVLYFNYMLDHPLLVNSPEEKRHLLSKLVHQPDQNEREKYISPETVQRFIKAAVFPGLKKRTTELLAKLHETLLAMASAKPKDYPAGPSLAQRDLVFSLSFILLVIVGQSQARLLMLSELSRSGEKGINLSLQEAEMYINEVENSLANYIINFHEVAVNKRAKPRAPVTPISPMELGPEEVYSAKFGLMKQVEDLTRKYSSKRPSTFERGELIIEEFDKDNIHRLCWKFVEPLFGRGE